MEECKEFQGKNLDEAIRSACVYFDAPREKLEIEIIEDAKSGLFGIVGVRKATIRARRASIEKFLEEDTPAGHSGRNRAVREVVPAPGLPNETAEAEKGTPEEIASDEGHEVVQKTPSRTSKPSRRRQSKQTDAPGGREKSSRGPRQKPRRQEPPVSQVEDDGSEHGEPRVPFEELDQEKMMSLAQEAARQLVTPILGDSAITVSIAGGHVEVNVDCGEHSGLLIGREGQTLAALQYIASRIVSAGMGATVRVQFNVGDYRERQDERLRELAFVLADRVRATGRSCSTRPMSSYHRRIIHLALQDAPDVQTHSSGEGPMKRIIVQKKKLTEQC